MRQSFYQNGDVSALHRDCPIQALKVPYPGKPLSSQIDSPGWLLTQELWPPGLTGNFSTYRIAGNLDVGGKPLRVMSHDHQSGMPRVIVSR